MASLFGASFCDGDPKSGAVVDKVTRIERAAIEALTPIEQRFLADALDRAQ